MRNYLILVSIVLLATACNKKIDEIRPLVKVDKDGQLASAAGIVEATTGNYTLMFGDYNISYEESLGNISEGHGNNVTLRTFGIADKTNDAFFFRNSPGVALGYSNNFYRASYQMIVSINTTLEGIANYEKNTFPTATEADQNAVLYAKGENHFLRALAYFNLVKVFGKPYYQGAATNKAVPLKKTSDIKDAPEPATVKEIYDYVIAEAQLAVTYLKTPVTKPNSFASKEAAWALLSRAYLYMGGSFAAPNATFNQLSVTYADSVLDYNDGKNALLQGDAYRNFFAADPAGELGRANFANNKEIILAMDNATGSTRLGIIYNYDAQLGAGCIFLPSAELLALFTPQDIRGSFFKVNAGTGLKETSKYDVLMVQLFSHAPNIYFRTGELYLNRAEAYAKMGDFNMARTNLTAIHTRAGLPAADITGISNADLLTAILKERRMELAFEGHLGFDNFRNGLPMNRPAADNNGTALNIPADDPRTVFAIPNF